MNHRCFSFRLKKTYSNFWWGELVKSASLPWERWRLAHCSPAAWPGRRRCVTSASCDDGLFCSVCETCNTRLTSQCSDHTIVVCGVKMWESKFDISASFSGNDTTTFFDAWRNESTHSHWRQRWYVSRRGCGEWWYNNITSCILFNLALPIENEDRVFALYGKSNKINENDPYDRLQCMKRVEATSLLIVACDEANRAAHTGRLFALLDLPQQSCSDFWLLIFTTSGYRNTQMWVWWWVMDAARGGFLCRGPAGVVFYPREGHSTSFRWGLLVCKNQLPLERWCPW